ncbi:MAG TPA: hypothetical protein VK784_02610, partial [Pseudonocardiaceae bacterium]|nr:hypothetical protein [Pseudonocardiaceae bacterium]
GSIGQGQLSFTVANATFSSFAPGSPHLNDLWYDGSNGNELKQWNGAAWVPYQFGTNAIAALSVTASQIAANTITASQIAANTITAGQIAARTISADLLAVGNLVNQNVYFAGGDTTGWDSYGSTISGTTSPPAGAPFPSAVEIVTDGTSAGPSFYGTAKFPVTAGQYYLVTAWVFTAMTSVGVGIDWYDATGASLGAGSTTNTVTASAWTQISTLSLAPAGTVSGLVFCTLPSVPPNGTVLYATEVRLFSPVNGGIIEAGTIEGASIVAGSVTADRLVSGIVVAGIIDATTVTAATFSGSTFVGTNWLENAAGEFFYSSTPAAGDLAISITPTSGTDPHTNPYLNGITAYGYTPPGGTGPATAQLSSTAFDPVFNMITGAGSENASGQVVSHTVNPNTATEYMQTILRGPASTYDSTAMTVTLSSATANGANPGIGTLTSGGSAVLSWTAGGVSVTGGIGAAAIHTSGIGEFDNGVQVDSTTVINGSAQFAVGVFATGVGITAASFHVSGNGQVDGTLTVNGGIGGNSTGGISGFTSIHTSGIGEFDGGVQVGSTSVVNSSAQLATGVFAPTVGVSAVSAHFGSSGSLALLTDGYGQFNGGVQVGSTSVINSSAQFATGTFASGVGVSAASIHTSGVGRFDGLVETNGVYPQSGTAVGMYYNSSSYSAYWDSGGVHVTASLFGTGGTITVGDSISCSGNLSINSVTCSGGLTVTGSTTLNSTLYVNSSISGDGAGGTVTGFVSCHFTGSGEFDGGLGGAGGIDGFDSHHVTGICEADGGFKAPAIAGAPIADGTAYGNNVLHVINAI